MNKKSKIIMIITFILVQFIVLTKGATLADWSKMKSGEYEPLYSVWGSSGTDVFAVGAEGNYLSIIAHYDGSSWSKMASGRIYGDTVLFGVWGSSGTDVFAVSRTSSSIILHYNGSSWSTMDSVTTEPLYSIWGSSGTDVFAVGWDGRTNNSIILHYDGSSWSQMDSGTIGYLYSIWGSSGTDVFAVGSTRNSIILHYDGSSWSQMDSGTESDFYSVWGSSGTDVFAVGQDDSTNNSIIVHYDGSSWSTMDGGTISDTRLYGVWGSSGTDVFAVGLNSNNINNYNNSIIVHYDGSSWSEMERGTYRPLYSVWGSSGTDVFAVGDGGTILHYEPTPMTTTSTTTIDPNITTTTTSTSFISTTTSTTIRGAIHSGRGIVRDGGHFNFGTGKIEYSVGYLGRTGYLYGTSFSNPTFYFGDTISPSPCHSGYDGYQGISVIKEFTSADEHIFTTQRSIMVGDKNSGCYQGILLFKQNGLYGGIDPVDVDKFNSLHYNWWYEDAGNSDFSDWTAPTFCPSELIFGENSDEIQVLRYIRDNVLTHTPEGQEVIKLYYQWNPVIVKAMEEDEEFKEEVKEMIDGVLGLVE